MAAGAAVNALTVAALWPAAEALRLWLAWRELRAMPAVAASADPTRLQRVDVLQAVRGGDASLAQTLAWNLAELGALGARLHWLIDHDDALAPTAVQAALAAHPGLQAQVVVSVHPSCPPKINPKLYKLDRVRAQCERAILLMLDDDARLPAASFDALLAALDAAGAQPCIATALPAYLPADGLPSQLLAGFVNANAALTYLPARRGARSPSINGMAWAIRGEHLDALGGFAPHLQQLTDDLAMAQALLRAGGRIEQRSEPVWMRTQLDGYAAYLRQMQRWMVFARLLLASQRPAMRARIVVEQGLPQLLPFCAVAAACLAPDWTLYAAVGIGAALHLFGRRALQRACTGVASTLTPQIALLVALLQPLHLAHAWVWPRIHWRQHRYRVYANDRFEELR